MGRTSGKRMFLLAGFCLASACAMGWPIEPANYPQTTYHNEQSWIISDISRNLFELLSFAKDGRGEVVKPDQVHLAMAPANMLSSTVTIARPAGKLEATLKWPDSIWSPDAYQPLAEAVCKALPPVPAKGDPQGDPLHALLAFTESSIEAENERVSNWLNAEPGNWNAHEQAAFVVSTLAMKDSSGRFFDVRDMMSHACAHLAAAQVLRGHASAGVPGRLAECMIDVLASRKVAAEEKLKALGSEKPSADTRAWINALHLRNTRDWRYLAKPEEASPVEQIQHFFALSTSIGTTEAVAWVEKNKLPDRPEWAWVILDTSYYTVETGHKYANGSVDVTLRAMRATFPKSFDTAHIVDDLNQIPSDVLAPDGPDAGRLTVVNRGMWAYFYQRLLSNAIVQTGWFFNDKWGVKDKATTFDREMRETYGLLTLYPNVQLNNWQLRTTTTPPDQEVLSTLFLSRPELTDYSLRSPKGLPPPPGGKLMRQAFQWYLPPFPQGTAYSVGTRLDGYAMTPEDVHRLYALAPLNPHVAEAEMMMRKGQDGTYADFQGVFGPLLDYNLWAIKLARRAKGMTWEQRMEIGRRAAALDPEALWQLGYDCLIMDHEKDAVSIYQEYFDKGTDRVSVSNSMDWLVDYYYKHGQPEKATEIAKACAEVYSYSGLNTLVHLYEKTGDYDKSEEVARKIKERYDSIGALAAVYKFRADHDEAGYKEKLDQLVALDFPQGLRKVTVGSFTGPPQRGVGFAITNTAMSQNDLKKGQVIVALDGYAIETIKQYTIVTNFSQSMTMTFIVWDPERQAVREIVARVPDHYLGAQLTNYQR